MAESSLTPQQPASPASELNAGSPPDGWTSWALMELGARPPELDLPSGHVPHALDSPSRSMRAAQSEGEAVAHLGQGAHRSVKAARTGTEVV